MNDRYQAQRREQQEPKEGNWPVPRFLIVLVAVLVVWGVGYIASDTGSPLRGGDSRTAYIPPSKDKVVDGKTVFSAHCAACHQATGQGLPGAFPPLAGSEWVLGNPERTVAIVHDGLTGELTVKGMTFNGSMPAFHGQLSNEELAAVVSYVRSEWGNKAAPVDVSTVVTHEELPHPRDPWNVEALKNAFGNK